MIRIILKYLKNIVVYSCLFRSSDANGNNKNTCGLWFLICIISLLFLCNHIQGLSYGLSNIIVTFLSIYIGLFTTILVFISEKKYHEPKYHSDNVVDQIMQNQLSYFYREAPWLIGFDVLLAILTLMVILFNIDDFNSIRYDFWNITCVVCLIKCFSVVLSLTFVSFSLSLLFFDTIYMVAVFTSAIGVR